MALITELTEIIENENILLDVIKTELVKLKIYGDERKTIIRGRRRCFHGRSHS